MILAVVVLAILLLWTLTEWADERQTRKLYETIAASRLARAEGWEERSNFWKRQYYQRAGIPLPAPHAPKSVVDPITLPPEPRRTA